MEKITKEYLISLLHKEDVEVIESSIIIGFYNTSISVELYRPNGCVESKEKGDLGLIRSVYREYDPKTGNLVKEEIIYEE